METQYIEGGGTEDRQHLLLLYDERRNNVCGTRVLEYLLVG